MKRMLVAALWMATTGFMAAAEEKFSKTIPAGDFSAAGLAKLSPEELARLDALVRDYKSGVLEAARREAIAQTEARARAEAKAARAESEAAAIRTKAEAQAQARAKEKEEAAQKSEKSDGSLLARAKVLLTPGTKIEYATVESRIAGEFRGWEGRTTFVLENGQRWQSAGESTYVTPAVAGPAVKITPGALGTFWLTVEGVKPRVKVMPLESRK